MPVNPGPRTPPTPRVLRVANWSRSNQGLMAGVCFAAGTVLALTLGNQAVPEILPLAYLAGWFSRGVR